MGIDVREETVELHQRKRLTQFFERARWPLRMEAKEEARDLEISRHRFSRFIEQLRAPLDGAEARACANPWLTAALCHDEVRVSAVLAALWDRRQYGDEARAFLARFFARAGNGLPDEVELAGGYRVQTESCLNGSVADRVDITVETRKSIIGIEVKIYAGEGEDQLSRYLAAMATRARLMRRDRCKVIFLAPYSSRGAKEIANVTWRTVGETAAQADDSSHAGWLIQQFGRYCCSLGS
ncbi:MAG TPA: PD-(D/E)XK nuclease family protein [Allosphingosinicella sp.]|jgi:hypothetical protein